MNPQFILSRLESIFREILDQPQLVLGRQSSADHVPGWDSLSHVSLIAAVEAEFGIQFSARELKGMKNVGDLVDLLGAKAS